MEVTLTTNHHDVDGEPKTKQCSVMLALAKMHLQSIEREFNKLPLSLICDIQDQFAKAARDEGWNKWDIRTYWELLPAIPAAV